MKKTILILITILSVNTNAEIQCRDDGSTVEMRACFIDDLRVEEINLANALEIALEQTDWIVKEIHQSQDAWIKYRDSQCNAVYAKASGGTIGIISQPACLVDLTKTRAIKLLNSFTSHTNVDYSSKSSPDTKSTATLYTSIKPLEEGELPMQIMRFATPTEDWLRTIDEWSNIKKYEFIDNEHLLIVTRSSTVTGTGILNMETQHLEWIGGGTGEIISWNDNKKLIKLYGNKSYRWDENMEPMGAMWYDLIVNETGDIIQLLTPDYWELVSSNGERRIDYSTLSEECIPIKDILRSYDPEYYANIEQSLDDCIRVNR